MTPRKVGTQYQLDCSPQEVVVIRAALASVAAFQMDYYLLMTPTESRNPQGYNSYDVEDEETSEKWEKAYDERERIAGRMASALRAYADDIEENHPEF